jgi:hypothetical protein
MKVHHCTQDVTLAGLTANGPRCPSVARQTHYSIDPQADEALRLTRASHNPSRTWRRLFINIIPEIWPPDGSLFCDAM